MKLPTSTAEWLDAVKSRHNIPSDYALAKRLGVTHNAISNYRNGVSSMDPYIAAQLAKLLNLDPLKAIATAEMERSERAGNPDRKDFWEGLTWRRGSISPHLQPSLF